MSAKPNEVLFFPHQEPAEHGAMCSSKHQGAPPVNAPAPHQVASIASSAKQMKDVIEQMSWDGVDSLTFKEAKQLVVERFEEIYLRPLAVRHRNNLSAASRESGLSRRHLRTLFRKYGLIPEASDPEDDS